MSELKTPFGMVVGLILTQPQQKVLEEKPSAKPKRPRK